MECKVGYRDRSMRHPYSNWSSFNETEQDRKSTFPLSRGEEVVAPYRVTLYLLEMTSSFSFRFGVT